MVYLTTNFNHKMLAGDSTVKFEKVSCEDVPEKSFHCVHFASLANVLSDLLGFRVHVNKKIINLKAGDVVYICSVNGKVDPDDTVLPYGCSVAYYKATIIDGEPATVENA